MILHVRHDLSIIRQQEHVHYVVRDILQQHEIKVQVVVVVILVHRMRLIILVEVRLVFGNVKHDMHSDQVAVQHV